MKSYQNTLWRRAGQAMSRQKPSSSLENVELVAECYANKCIADKLSQALRKRMGCEVRVKHTYRHGRDRVVSEILKRPLAGQQRLIAVIDYERGISREYINNHFELEEVVNSIFAGVSRSKPGVVAIVFDPDVESAFLCRISKERCKNKSLLERIKSRRACNAVEGIVEGSREGERILSRLSEEVLNRLLAH